MSRIAQAQRKAGRYLATEAEFAWHQSVSAVTGFPASTRSQSAGPDLQRIQDPSGGRGGPALPFPPPAKAPGYLVDQRGSADPHTELSSLVSRVFWSPPVGAGAQVVLFCAVADICERNSIACDAAAIVAEQTASPVCVLDVRVLHEQLELTGRADALVTNLAMDVDTACRRLPGLVDDYRYIMLNASQGAVTAPILTLASAVDGIVLLVSENFTRREVAKTTVENLQASAARLLGVVLTDRTYPIPTGIYRRL